MASITQKQMNDLREQIKGKFDAHTSAHIQTLIAERDTIETAHDVIESLRLLSAEDRDRVLKTAAAFYGPIKVMR